MQPRQILPGTTYLLTRRCSQRTLLLTPSPLVDQILLYCLAYAARRTGVRVHAFVFLSNHHHLIVSDPQGNLPDFCHSLHGLSARALNSHYGRWENFWSNGTYSAVKLESAQDVLEKLAYLLSNPVSSELVPRYSAWPGLVSRIENLAGTVRRATRPRIFFSSKTQCPRRIDLHLSCPPELRHRPIDNLIAELQELVSLRERSKAEEMRQKGRRFLGRKRILAQDPRSRPASREPRRRLNPRVAARDRWRRVEALLRLTEFRKIYAECRGRFKSGEREVLFPYGTFGPQRLYGARVEAFAPG